MRLLVSAHPHTRSAGQLAPKPGSLGPCSHGIRPHVPAAGRGEGIGAPYGPDEDNQSKFRAALAVSQPRGSQRGIPGCPGSGLLWKRAKPFLTFFML